MIKKIQQLAIGNALLYFLSVFISYASQFQLLRFKNTMATVSAKYESLFTPAGVTFAIWGLIYTALFAFCLYHLYHAFTKHADEWVNKDVNSIGNLFMVNNLAVFAWVFAWLNEYMLISVVLMFIQLITLLFIQLRIKIYDTRRSLWSKIFTQFPLSIYFAWICIATIANSSAYLVAIGWDGWGISPASWAIILIGIAALLTIFMVFVRKNVFFALVVMWALYGIVLKRQQAGDYQQIIVAAWSAFALIALSAIIQQIKNVQSSRPSVH